MPKAHVVRHVQVREQRVVLEHHADAPLLGWHMLWLALLTTCARERISPPPRAPARPRRAAAWSCRSPRGRSARRCRRRAGRTTRRPPPAAAPGVLHTQLGDFQVHANHCRCLQFSFASHGICPIAHACCAGSSPCCHCAGPGADAAGAGRARVVAAVGRCQRADPGRDGAHRAARLRCGPRCACACWWAWVWRWWARHGGGGDAV
jgi:hypothetical protein